MVTVRRVDDTRRVRHLISLDATALMQRLLTRQAEMVGHFSRSRDRSAMVSALDSWFSTITFSDLARLEPVEQRAIAAFFGLVNELGWYLRYTEDMPGQVQLVLSASVRKLELAQRLLVATIGMPDAEGAPAVEARVSRRRAHARKSKR